VRGFDRGVFFIMIELPFVTSSATFHRPTSR
jgi:hypothetical protein